MRPKIWVFCIFATLAGPANANPQELHLTDDEWRIAQGIIWFRPFEAVVEACAKLRSDDAFQTLADRFSARGMVIRESLAARMIDLRLSSDSDQAMQRIEAYLEKIEPRRQQLLGINDLCQQGWDMEDVINRNWKDLKFLEALDAIKNENPMDRVRLALFFGQMTVLEQSELNQLSDALDQDSAGCGLESAARVDRSLVKNRSSRGLPCQSSNALFLERWSFNCDKGEAVFEAYFHVMPSNAAQIIDSGFLP